MRIAGHRIVWEAHDEQALEAILRRRDGRGGALFWLSDEARSFPCLALRVSGDLSDIHFFPHEDHAGFRCLGNQDLPPGGTTTFVFEGCDPGYGEETPNEFVVPFATALAVAKEFLRTKQMASWVQWFEF
jgi:hypothetical protein